MAITNPPAWLSGETHPAANARRLIEAQTHRQGIVNDDDLEVSAAGGMDVDVAVGAAFIEGTENTFQGMYYADSDSVTALTLSAADATNDRIDLVVIRVKDADYSGADSEAAIEVVEGTAAPSPVNPTTPDNALALALVTVPAGAVAVSGGDILDARGQYVPQGVTPVVALPTGTRTGETVYHSGRLKAWTGSAWASMATTTEVQTAAPAGTISMFAGTSAPSGWAVINGATLSNAQTTYPDLWAVVPSSWKSGSDIVLPDATNRFPLGHNSTTPGTTGGSSSVSLTTSNLPPHSHSMNHNHPSDDTSYKSGHTHNSGDIRDQLINRNLSSLPADGGWQVWEGVNSATTGTAGGHDHTFDVPNYTGNTGNQGSGTAVSLPTPPYFVVRFIIKL